MTNTTYIQQNTVVRSNDALEDGIAIEVAYTLDVSSHKYESHGTHTINDVLLNILYANMIIIEKGVVICRGDITDLEPIELFLTNNIGLL